MTKAQRKALTKPKKKATKIVLNPVLWHEELEKLRLSSNETVESDVAITERFLAQILDLPPS